MTDRWYDLADTTEPLSQGDLIFECPVLNWQSGSIAFQEGRSREAEVLENAIEAVSVDVVVMTQDCDLEQRKVENVILCPHMSLDDHHSYWHSSLQEGGHNPTERAWKAHCDDICKGFIFNYMMLNRFKINESSMDVRVVYFHEVFTIPRSFLESLLVGRAQPRFRLLSPYKEHLSQAFARFFMRVGLPTPIEKSWQS